MKTTSLKLIGSDNKTSYSILLFLLMLLFINVYVSPWVFGAYYPNWYVEFYLGLTYLLVVVLIWLNRTNPEKINVDKTFVFLVMLGAGSRLITLPSGLGLFSLVILGVISWALMNNLVHFGGQKFICSMEIWILTAVSVVVAVAPIVYYQAAVTSPLSNFIIITTLFKTDLAVIVVEELVFRGASWAFLRDIGLDEKKIILVQAVLFWIYHFKYLFLSNPYSFWIAVPLNSLIFGVMVWRSKSLVPSTISHFLFNFIILITKLIY